MTKIGEMMDRAPLESKLRLPGARNLFHDEVFKRGLPLPLDKVLPIICDTPKEAKSIASAVAYRMRAYKRMNPETDFVLRTRRYEDTLYVFKVSIKNSEDRSRDD